MRTSLIRYLLPISIAAALACTTAGISAAAISSPIEDGVIRADAKFQTAQAVIVPTSPTSCSCGGFMCEGKEYPSCTIQCGAPQAAACECGYCERSLGAPSSSRVGPVANLCECR